MTDPSGEDPHPNYTPVTPRGRQQEMTADGEGTAVATHARARAARVREAMTLPGIAVIAERAQTLVSRRASAGEGTGTRNLWRDGAESPAEILQKLAEGPDGGEEWPRWRLTGWQVYMLFVALSWSVLGMLAGAVFGRPLRGLISAVLIVLLAVSFLGGPQDEAGAPGPATGATGGERR